MAANHMPHGSSESHPPCFVTFQPAKVEQLIGLAWVGRIAFTSTSRHATFFWMLQFPALDQQVDSWMFSNNTKEEKHDSSPKVTKDSGNLACSKVTFCRQFPASFSTWQEKTQKSLEGLWFVWDIDSPW